MPRPNLPRLALLAASLLVAPAVSLTSCEKRAPETPPAAPSAQAEPSCPDGMFPDAGRCVTPEEPCPPKHKLAFGRGCVREDDPGDPPAVLAPAPKQSPELSIDDVTVGTGAEAVAGKRVRVHYTGTLEDGTKFDSSWDRGQAFEFEVGKNHVIRGWEQGILGMRVGGKRRLTMAHTLAYGERGHPPKIPPRATLVFVIDLLEVR